jgi:hypothetical protein
MTRLIAADVLKLRRRRALMAWSLVLTLGLVVLFYAWRLANGAEPAGGRLALDNLMEGLLLLGGVAPILVGAAAGAGDLGAGVLRDLVATGRPRVHLFLARVPATLVVVVAFALVAALAAAVGATVLAGHHVDAASSAPGAGTVARDVVWLVAGYAFLGVLACGVSALLGTQATSIGLLLGWQLAASTLLVQVDELGSLRDWIPLSALDRLQPTADHFLQSLAPGLAVVVLVVWAVAATVAGARRTATADL